MRNLPASAWRSILLLMALHLFGCQKQVFQFQEIGVVNNPPPPTEPAAGARRTESALRIHDRKLLDSTLTGIFGPTAAPITGNLILKSPDFFGRPCDTAEPSAQGDPACQVNINTSIGRTHIPGSVNTPSTLPASITSEILRIRACEEVIAKDEAVTYAARLAESVGDSESISAELPVPDEPRIAGAFELFHPGKVAPAEVISALKNLGDASSAATPDLPALEGWRLILLTLCLDPSWQLL